MRKQPQSSPISNLALFGVAVFAVITLAVLSALLFSLHPQRIALNKPTPEPEKSVNVSIKIPAARSPMVSDEDAPVIRLTAKETAPDLTPQLAVAVAEPELVQPAPQETPAIVEPAPAATIPVAPTSAKKEENNELIPEINGISYTMKKALSNGTDPSNPGKPDPARPVKKPDPKKPSTLIPSKPANPLKPEPPKVAQPKTPELPPLDSSKVDFSKAPIYVLNDGRRIRALSVRDNGKEITIKNEAGKDITFKKTDVKEILKS
jgi:hypothetical protein